jgi:hypothetical protein
MHPQGGLRMINRKNISALLGTLLMSAGLLTSCNVPTSTPKDETPFSFNTIRLFPFQDINNWWHYTEKNGNVLSITVIDTISDNNITYYKVSFKENNRDTTDDWFRSSSDGIQYNTHLIGTYDTFLPAGLQGKTGTFKSAADVVSYTYQDSSQINGKLFTKVVACKYPATMLHGFDEIDFADSIGIVSMVDTTGRFPTVYALDSAYIDGVLRKF